MGFNQRMREWKKKMRELARELSDDFPVRPSEEEWEDIKEVVHIEASEGKHEVYGEDNENRDRNQGRGEIGHEERLDIYRELKNEFHREWKKLRKRVENKESESISSSEKK